MFTIFKDEWLPNMTPFFSIFPCLLTFFQYTSRIILISHWEVSWPRDQSSSNQLSNSLKRFVWLPIVNSQVLPCSTGIHIKFPHFYVFLLFNETNPQLVLVLVRYCDSRCDTTIWLNDSSRLSTTLKSWTCLAA